MADGDVTREALYDPDPYWGEGETRSLRSYPEANNRLQRLQRLQARLELLLLHYAPSAIMSDFRTPSRKAGDYLLSFAEIQTSASTALGK